MPNITFYPHPKAELSTHCISSPRVRNQLWDALLDSVAAEERRRSDDFDTMRALIKFDKHPLDVEEVTILTLDGRAAGSIDRELNASEWETVDCQVHGPQDNPWARYKAMHTRGKAA